MKRALQISARIVKDKSMYDRVKQYRESKRLTAKAFEEYSMPGTPSAFLVDKNGLLRHFYPRISEWRNKAPVT
jgi:hypothetical protein